MDKLLQVMTWLERDMNDFETRPIWNVSLNGDGDLKFIFKWLENGSTIRDFEMRGATITIARSDFEDAENAVHQVYAELISAFNTQRKNADEVGVMRLGEGIRGR